MGEVASLAVHESQARLWKNTVGRSRPFWAYFFPLARSIFQIVPKNSTEQTFLRERASTAAYIAYQSAQNPQLS